MSSDYMTWILNDEYNRVQRADNEAARRRAAADNAVRRARENAREAQREVSRQAAQNDQQLRRQVEAETSRLLAGIDSLESEMRSNYARYVRETQQQMAGIRQSVADVERRADQVDRKIDDLAEQTAARFRQLADAQTNQRNRAQAYANQLNSVLARVKELHPDKFEPETFADLQMAADFVRVDMTNGDYQAAIGVAQSNLPAALALQSRLERLNEEFELLRRQVRDCTEVVFGRIKELQTADNHRRIVVIGDGEYEYDGLIAYWSNGLFDRARQNMYDLCQRAAESEINMDLDNMRLSLSHLEQIDAQVTECQQLAESEFYLCGMIQNMAGSIYSALTRDEAWELLESGFADDDARRSYHMSYTDGAGNTAAFVVLPNREVGAGGKPGEIQFLVDVCDGEKIQDQNRCYLVRRGILQRLEQSRIDVGRHNRTDRYLPFPSTTRFIEEATQEGDHIKDGRLQIVREQLQLVNNIQESEQNGV